ncbi:Phosphatidylinositol 4-kinase pik1alpha (PI4-kinase)(PtdIns-4-kinase), partial [Tilletia horrida]
GADRDESEAREDGEKPKKSMGAEDLATVMRAVNKDDPSAAIFRESWAAKKTRIQGHFGR